MRVVRELNLDNVVFIDIETVTIEKELNQESVYYDAWEYTKRKDADVTDEHIIEMYKQEGSLKAEFSKIICITVGRIVEEGLRVKTYNNEIEKDLLDEFNNDLNRVTNANKKTVLCGHAIIGFDIPFIFKRCMVHQTIPNKLLDVSGLKPWEVTAIDTKELWKGTDFRPSSLLSITTCLGLPNPKSDISGKDVGKVYYSEGKEGLERISRYCERDVLGVANIIRFWRHEPILDIITSSNKEEVKDIPLLVSLSNGATFGTKAKEDLEDVVEKLNNEEKEQLFLILEALAVSKESRVTRTYVSKLKENYK